MPTAFVKEWVRCLSCDARDSNVIIQLAQSILLARKQPAPVPPASSRTSSSNCNRMHGIDLPLLATAAQAGPWGANVMVCPPSATVTLTYTLAPPPAVCYCPPCHCHSIRPPVFDTVVVLPAGVEILARAVAAAVSERKNLKLTLSHTNLLGALLSRHGAAMSAMIPGGTVAAAAVTHGLAVRLKQG